MNVFPISLNKTHNHPNPARQDVPSSHNRSASWTVFVGHLCPYLMLQRKNLTKKYKKHTKT